MPDPLMPETNTDLVEFYRNVPVASAATLGGVVTATLLAHHLAQAKKGRKLDAIKRGLLQLGVGGATAGAGALVGAALGKPGLGAAGGFGGGLAAGRLLYDGVDGKNNPTTSSFASSLLGGAGGIGGAFTGLLGATALHKRLQGDSPGIGWWALPLMMAGTIGGAGVGSYLGSSIVPPRQDKSKENKKEPQILPK